MTLAKYLKNNISETFDASNKNIAALVKEYAVSREHFNKTFNAIKNERGLSISLPRKSRSTVTSDAKYKAAKKLVKQGYTARRACELVGLHPTTYGVKKREEQHGKLSVK